jgi:hypothetical protein
VTCVVCNEALNANEESESAWYPEPWCLKCMKEEDERGYLEERLPHSEIRFSLPRYYGTKSQWGPGVASDEQFEKLVTRLLDGDEDEGSDD